MDYKTTNITLKGMEDKGLTLVITDTNDNKWTIWKKAYQSEDDSEAFGAFKNFHIGESFGISYGEKEESFVGKDGKQVNFTRRTIYNILPEVSSPAQISSKSPAQTNTSNTEPSGAPHTASSDVFWEKKAYKQCLWNYWLETFAKGHPQTGNAMYDEVWKVFKNIEADADKRFLVTEPLPLEPPLNIEDIPF